MASELTVPSTYRSMLAAKAVAAKEPPTHHMSVRNALFLLLSHSLLLRHTAIARHTSSYALSPSDAATFSPSCKAITARNTAV